MNFDTLRTVNEDTYRIVLLLLNSVTLIVGLASLMFVLVAILCAAWDSLGEMFRSARAQMRSARRVHYYETPGTLASLEAFDGAARVEPSSIH